MFMSHQHTYAYPAQPQPAPARQYSGHATSSAFSSSANPDEDWTKISDLAERRRIQNRIAQRNYRKKLKRRLEELERRAGTSDGASSTSSSGNEKASSSSAGKNSSSSKRGQSMQASKAQKQQQPSISPQQKATISRAGQYTPPMHHDDEYLFPTSYDDRERSNTPPMFNYPAPSYPPPPEEMMMHHNPYGSVHPAYRPMTESYPEYVTASTVPVTLPSMTHFSDALKREPGYSGEDGSMPQYVSYSYLPGGGHGGDMAGPSPYDQMPHTPPLSQFDHSTTCSDSGSYEYPTTPLSMPGSPGMVQHA